MTIVATSFIASIIAAGFLFPYLQAALVLAAIPGAICGTIAGWKRSRVGAIVAVAGLAGLYVIRNFDGDGGIHTAIEMHLLGKPAPNVRYFHTWYHLFHALVIPTNLGVALVACELMGRRRTVGDSVGPPTCDACGYNLTGNVSGRCPECGSPCSTSAE
jgi:hypothetical protein